MHTNPWCKMQFRWPCMYICYSYLPWETQPRLYMSVHCICNLKKKHKKNRNIYKDFQCYLILTSPSAIFTQTITFAIVHMFIWWFDQKKLTRMFTWKTLVLRTLHFSCVHTGTCIAAISLRKRVAGIVNLSQMYTGCCKENID